MSLFFHVIFICTLFFSSIASQAAARGLLDRFALHPSTHVLQSQGEQRILSSGLEAYIYRNKPLETRSSANPIYLLHFIGNASRAEIEAPDFLKLFPEDVEAELWSVNYPGYGGSSGEASLKNFPQAALNAYEEIEKSAQGNPIWVSSFSIGTLPGLYLARQKPVKAIIMRNPIPLKQFIFKNYGWASWIVSEIPTQLDVLVNAENTHLPALFLSSENDSLVTPSLQKQVLERYAGPSQLVILPGADHNSQIPGSSYPVVQKALKNLISRSASSTSALRTRLFGAVH